MLFDIKDIAVIKRQRTAMDPKKLQELADDIKSIGRLIHPIVVRYTRPEDLDSEGNHPKEQFALVAGGRRLAAHVLLQREQIEGRLFEQLSPVEQEIIELSENLYREDISWQDAIKAKERIHKLRQTQNPFHSLENTASELGETKGNTSKDLKLAAAMRANPGIASAPTKRAALRQIDHQMEIASRILRIADTDISDIKSKVHTADARTFARTLATDSVDFHFTDLPYGIGYKSISSGGQQSHVLGEYDDSEEKVRDMITDLVPEMARSVKPGGWIACFFAVDGIEWLKDLFRSACSVHGQYRVPDEVLGDKDTQCYGKFEDNLEGDCRFLIPEPMPWVWYRPNSRNLSQWPDRHAKHVYETILVCNGGDAKFTELHLPDLLVYDTIYDNRMHEMQKPHDLCCEIIRRMTVPGELVVDLCAGSGALLAAAADLGRDFRGCDDNPTLLPTMLAHIAGFYKPGATKAAQNGLAHAEATRSSLRLTPD